MKNDLLIILISFLLSACASYKSDGKFEKTLNLRYGSHERNVGDFYKTFKKSAPIIFTVHPGSWSGRSKEDMNTIAESLASHGRNVFNINYRFAPEFKHPSQIDDLKQAVEFIKEKYKDHIDTNKVGLWGYSSGAHTVMMYGLQKENKVSAIVGGGGPYDFTWWPGSPLITPYMGYERDENIQGWLDASPITQVSNDAPPLFLYNGEDDDLVPYEQMTSLDARAKLVGMKSEFYLVDHWGHALTFVFSSEAVKRAILFLNKTFAQSS